MNFRWTLTLGIGVCSVRSAALAALATLPTVAWQAPLECPQAIDVQERLLQLVGEGLRSERPSGAEFSGAVEKLAEGHWQVELEVKMGEEVANRALSGESCAEVTEAAVVERCVPATIPELSIYPSRDAPASIELENRCGDASVFWVELGAGTAALLEVEPCGYQPFDLELGKAEPCKLGDPNIPLLCGCACQ